MPIVLLTTWVLGPHHTIFMVATTALISQVHLLPQGPRTADWHVILSLVPALTLGIAAGTFVLTQLDASGLMVIMGFLVLSIVVMDRLHLVQKLSAKIDLRAPLVTSGLAMTSGTLGTMSGGGGMYFLVGYLMHACPNPSRFRGTNIVTAGVFMLTRFTMMAIAGLVSFEYIVEAVVLIPAIFGGTWAGTHFYKTASPKRFYVALQAIMLTAALALLIRGLMQLVWL